jgi:UDP-3-O-[3-hydroxymyristoyl] N-acetylglucosamine deacetylase
MSAVIVRGVGLHTGKPAVVTIRERGAERGTRGPVVLCAGGRQASIAELRTSATTRSTAVEAFDGALRVGTVEHLFAALGALGLYEGLAFEVEGPELPILDGGAAAWFDALAGFRTAATAGTAAGAGTDAGIGRPLRVARDSTIMVGASRYTFAIRDDLVMEVRVDLDDARLTPDARWTGDPADFRERIAPARTFVRERDMNELVARGLARHVSPESVVVLAPDVIHHAGRPFLPDEPARHKLLDLMGDAYLYGGPPVGGVSAFRPGHTANAEAFRRALAAGIVVRE